MTTAPDDSLTALAGSVRTSLHRFFEEYEPLRPELYRYCRYLTSSPWDAEDLAQDTLARAFVTLGHVGHPPPNPRAWLFRVASNLWIDQRRRRSLDAAAILAAPVATTDPRDSREAAGTLLVHLSPQERAAIVMKDVFDLTLLEIAEALGTTEGAVKAALHRGRGKLAEPSDPPLRVPASGVLETFRDAFNAGDLDRVRALLLDGASVEVVGATTEYGAGGQVLWGMMHGSERLARADVLGGIEPRFMRGALPTLPRAELRMHRDEPLILLWYAHTDGEAVRAVNRFETEGDSITRIQNYFFTPDFIAEVCAELDVPFRVNGYRWWLTGCKPEEVAKWR